MKTKILAYFAAAMAIIAVWGIGVNIKLKSELAALRAASAEAKAGLSLEEPDDEIARAIADANPDRSGGGEAEGAAVTNAAPTVLKIDGHKYWNGDEIALSFNARPDVDVARQYITVEPMHSGAASFRYTTPFNYLIDDFVPTIRISGDFAFRTNITLRVRKGFPAYDHGKIQPLAEDYVLTLKRNDRPCDVSFADKGRYLPAGGDRSLAIKSVNVAKIRTRVSSIPVANIVQMLSLEEDAYSNIRKNWWSDGEEFVKDLSGEPDEKIFEPGAEPNEDHVFALPLSGENGLFFVDLAALKADEDVVSRSCRVVAVTDIGLSVREDADGVLVWATSLTTGLPVAGARINVYSSANVLVFTGVTREDGLCRPDRVAKGSPFAVVASSANDTSFIVMRPSMMVGETREDGQAPSYLDDKELTAFAWTERGIYRHGENILFTALVRDSHMKAPPPSPFVVKLLNPSSQVFAEKTLMSDESGMIACEDIAIPEDQPSGGWTFLVTTPGAHGVSLATRDVKIEEFAPPQIRVKVKGAEGVRPHEFTFKVSAEHLYGGAAKSLKSEAAVVFEDVPFAPRDWKGYTFGSEDRSLSPSYRRVGSAVLDENGAHEYAAPLWAASGLPAAAVRATCEGTVFEDGGRPATARDSVVLHYYPYYIGSTLSSWVKKPESGYPEIPVACVLPNGRMLEEPMHLKAKIERVDSVFSYRRGENGWATWDTERVRSVVAEGIEFTTAVGEPTRLTLRLEDCADYVLTIYDPESEVAYSKAFYYSDWGDEGVRASLSAPERVSLVPDKAIYRPGDTPRLVVKSPFTGNALLTVAHKSIIHREVIALTNATSEVALPAATAAWWPSVDVAVSVVHGVEAGERHLAVRAHGETMLAVRPLEHELNVEVDAKVSLEGDAGARVAVDLATPGFDGEATAVVTLVDEGINLLTDEKVPDPVASLSEVRSARFALYDLYHRLLPIIGDDILRASGVKTGGGFGAELLSRVSPVPTRRFKPLALWQREVKISGGAGRVEFALPEFVGEVRVTALVYTSCATGAAAVRRKVSPKIIVQPDAPRFVAPGDRFEVALPIRNRSGDAAEISYSVAAKGAVSLVGDASGALSLADDDQIVVRINAVAGEAYGEGELVFTVEGAGEKHVRSISLPVRPAAGWVETAGVERLAPGKSFKLGAASPLDRVSYSVSKSPLTQLAGALQWLADYPHGCLEQTASRIFPLVTAQGILNSVEGVVISNREDYVKAGVRRVESMVRANDFTMWPDCNCAPWDREYSLYAVHFLIEAKKNGVELNPVAQKQVMRFMQTWARSSNDSVSAYACHNLALAGSPDMDRMLALYDKREKLSQLDRARLLRAFIAANDPKRAATLAASLVAPSSVKEAAFTLLALLEMDPDDKQIPSLVAYLLNNRDAQRFSWGTTSSNAHALLALGAYYSRMGAGVKASAAGGAPVAKRLDDGSVEFYNPGPGEAFAFWRKLSIPDPATITNSSSVLSIERTWRTTDGDIADLGNLTRGEALVCEIAITSSEAREFSDLVIEDLFPGAFEPIHSPIDTSLYPWVGADDQDWVMRSDARDDRMLVFSKAFSAKVGEKFVFRYPVRVVGAGEFILPACTVEAMYAPELRASTATGRIKIEK